MLRGTIEEEWTGIGQAGSLDQEESEERNTHESSRGHGPPTCPPLLMEKKVIIEFKNLQIEVSQVRKNEEVKHCNSKD